MRVRIPLSPLYNYNDWNNMKQKIVALFLGLAMAFSFTACGGSDDKAEPSAPVTVTETAEPDSGVSDEMFADLIRTNTDSFDNNSDSDIVEGAKLVCDNWDNGMSLEQMFAIVVDSGIDTYDAGFLVGAGTETYCPEYSDMLEDSTLS